MTEPKTHRALALLAGSWRGEGSGRYPEVPAFRYVEETTMTMAHDWKMLHVLQKTWQHDGNGIKQKPLHLETGLVICRDDGTLVYTCAQDSGRAEVMVGAPEVTPDGFHIAWETTAHANDPRLVKVGRSWWVTAETLRYEGYLSTVRTPEYQRHLEARLARDPA
jgi:THAP4-like, heme-binding beta-barrel domain